MSNFKQSADEQSPPNRCPRFTFWDFCAPFYDFAERCNGRAYGEMLKVVRGRVPVGATVLEVATGTAAIGIAISKNASRVLCTDISENMLKVARRKAKRRRLTNITFAHKNIFDLQEPDDSFDVVVAGQVLHLIDEPEIAAAELRRVARQAVILPMSFTKGLCGFSKLMFGFYRLIGFVPKREFDFEGYSAFLQSIGFGNCEFVHIAGRIPMVVAVWRS